MGPTGGACTTQPEPQSDFCPVCLLSRSSSRSPHWTWHNGWWCSRSRCLWSYWTSFSSLPPGTTWSRVKNWRSLPAPKAAACLHAWRASPGPLWPFPSPWSSGSTAPTLTWPTCSGPDWLEHNFDFPPSPHFPPPSHSSPSLPSFPLSLLPLCLPTCA